MISQPLKIVVRTIGLLAVAAGCSQSEPVAVPVELRTSVSEVGLAPTPTASRVPEIARSFLESTITEEIPEGESLPDDRTMAGVSTASIRESVERLWGRISMRDADAQPIPWVVRIDTGEGPVEIALLTALAPTHSRHLIALAKSGYYDGLCFDRIVRQESRNGAAPSRLELLRGGCPRGTGDEGIGHVGYWIEPEIDPTQKHEAGTVGFWHDADSRASGCRFYIALGPAPIMDGHFTIVGRVTSGLETLRKIADKPVLDAKTDPERFKNPTSIRRMTVSPELK